MRKQLIAVLIGVTVVSASSVWAHTDEYFDSKPSAHGGQTRMAGPYHIELVTTPGEVTVYLTDHIEQAISTADGEGKAVVKNGDTETTVMLAPADNNELKGKGKFFLDQNTEVVVFVKLPDREAWAATFSPLTPKAEASKHEMNHHGGADGHDGGHHAH